MLKLRGDELPGRLCRVIAADAGLRIAFQLSQSRRDGLTVCLSYAIVAAKRSLLAVPTSPIRSITPNAP